MWWLRAVAVWAAAFFFYIATFVCILALPNSRSSRDVAIYRWWRSCLSMRQPSCRWGSPRASIALLFCKFAIMCVSPGHGFGADARGGVILPRGRRGREVRAPGRIAWTGRQNPTCGACKTAETSAITPGRWWFNFHAVIAHNAVLLNPQHSSTHSANRCALAAALRGLNSRV